MRNYIIRRLLLMIPVLWLVTLGAFALIRLVPGDVLLSMVAESGNIPAKDLERVRHEMGAGPCGNGLWTGRGSYQYAAG